MANSVAALSSPGRQIFIMGLPSAGKTTFLAALWHFVESNEVQGSFKLNRLQGDGTYLNAIRDLWVQAQELERTKTPDEKNLLMVLERPDGSTFELWIPDLAGESFEAQWTDRVAGKQYCEYVRSSGCGLLFVHPNIQEEHLIADVDAIVPKVPESEKPEANTASENDTEKTFDEPDSWDPRFAPTQVQLVDLVQSMVALRNPSPVRLAIIISAWDLVTDEKDPEKWLVKHLPLLHQYLSVHCDVISKQCFGISAQGADFEVDGAIDKLRSCAAPVDRIQVCDGTYKGNDIGRPLLWLLQSHSNDGSNGK